MQSVGMVDRIESLVTQNSIVTATGKDVHLAGEAVSEPFSEPKSLKNRGTSDIILGS